MTGKCPEPAEKFFQFKTPGGVVPRATFRAIRTANDPPQVPCGVRGDIIHLKQG